MQELSTIIDPNDLDFVIDLVLQGTSYNFQILAFNAIGDGVMSAELEVIPAKLPDAPTDLEIVNAADTFITFSWLEPQDNGGRPITDYKVYVQDDQGDFVPSTPASVGSKTEQYTTGMALTPGSLYSFKVSAINALGEGALSDQASFYAVEIVGPPQNVVKTSADATSITISWSEPTVQAGSVITTYHVYKDDVKITPEPDGTSGALTW